MYVCSCCAVTDRTVRVAIASGASTVDEVRGRCWAGGGCGGCWPELQRLIDEHETQKRRTGRHAVA